LSLLEKSIQNNDATVISIFVNPTQFNNPEDLEKYPRTLENDIEKIKSISSEILVYAPSVEDIYEENTTSQQFDFDGLEHQMEGKFRAGHFDGVGTVVKRLFEIVTPHKSFFGKKDFQQFSVIREWVIRGEIGVEIVGCDTIRAYDGLALSSRNKRLSTEQAIMATAFSKALLFIQENKKKNNVKSLLEKAKELFIEKEQIELQYFTVANSETLEPLEHINEAKHQVALIAGFIGGVRLIDELELN
jgi:pantoate--beta-alanine ligase